MTFKPNNYIESIDDAIDYRDELLKQKELVKNASGL